MKNIVILTLIFVCSSLISQQNKTLSYGIQWGLQGNKSHYNGGLEEAHSRFQAKDHGGMAIDFTARYDHNSHWMVMSGLGFSSYGFEFALAENYFLLAGDRRYSVIRNDFAVINLPFMVYYKFDLDCKNRRWLVGGGFVASATERKDDTQTFISGSEGNTNSKYLISEANSTGSSNVFLRFSVARERLFKCGGIFHAGLIFNVGFTELAKANVLYTIEGREYNHEFINRGNFVGLRIAYFFKTGSKTFAE